jgi:hypothetical protein
MTARVPLKDSVYYSQFNANLAQQHIPGSAKANGREPKSCLGRVFNFKFGCFYYECNCMVKTNTPTFKVENSAQILSCYLCLSMLLPGNTKGGSITVLLTSCLTGLESAV